MLGVTDLGTYVLGAFLIILLPGPNSLYTLSVAARRGVRAGYRAAAGVFIGDTVLMVLSAAGAASLLKTNEMVFSVVKYTAGAYLAWLGIGMIRSAWQMWRDRDRRIAATEAAVTGGTSADRSADVQAAADDPSAEKSEQERPFRRAMVVSVLNPKAILFFVSFFIQFVDPAYAHPALSFLLLGLILNLFSMLYLSTLIFTGTYLAAQFRKRRRLSAGLSSAVGAVFMAFAAKLALSSVG